MSSTTAAGHFNVLYFASATSYTSKDSEQFEAPLTLTKLYDELETRYSGIQKKLLESCLVTVNLEYVDVNDVVGKDLVLKAGDEVAIIPPVSSG